MEVKIYWHSTNFWKALINDFMKRYYIITLSRWVAGFFANLASDVLSLQAFSDFALPPMGENWEFSKYEL